MKAGLKTVLEELKRVDEDNLISVFVPSKPGYINYKPLTMSHQKAIIKTALDPSATNIDYNISINNMLRTITDEGEILVSDKPAVLLALRAVNVDKTITIDKDDTPVKVNLNSLISKYDQIQQTGDIQYTKKVTYNDITVKLRVPTLTIDTKFMKECKRYIKKSTSPEDVSGNIGEMYVYEIAKFIDSVQHTTYSESESGKLVNTVMFSQTDVKDCISIVELLPMTLNKNISDYITSVRNDESRYTTTDKDVEIPTDATLFAIE
jgi:hypothetical protein